MFIVVKLEKNNKMVVTKKCGSIKKSKTCNKLSRYRKTKTIPDFSCQIEYHFAFKFWIFL